MGTAIRVGSSKRRENKLGWMVWQYDYFQVKSQQKSFDFLNILKTNQTDHES
jgi:hypothetical protein